MWTSLHTKEEAQAHVVFEEMKRLSKPYERSTVNSFADEFLQKAPAELSRKTVQLYRQSFTNFVRILGDRPLKSVMPLEVEKFKMVRAKEVAAVSVNIELKTLRAAFAEALRLKFISENPFTGSKKLRVPEKEGGFLTGPEFWRLLSAIDDKRVRDIVQFAVYTMMRRGEIVSLKWDQIDLERRYIHVKSTGEFRVKGGRSRWTPMSPWVYNYLRIAPRMSEFVFTRPNGLPYDDGYLSHRFKRYARKAGLPETIHFHSLRHTGVSWLINKGVPAPFVQKIAGHSSLAVTGIYTHLEDANLAAAIQVFDQIGRN